MGSLLLSRLGVRSLVVDLRGRTSTHPRSRLLDAASVGAGEEAERLTRILPIAE